MTTTPTPSPDVIEALALALDDVANAPFDKRFAASLIDELKERGFTITRAAPMSEAELEVELLRASITTLNGYFVTVETAMNVAKKYRG